MRPESSVHSVAFNERHYAVSEIAEMWTLDSDVIRRLFETEPGVMVLRTTETTPRKRK